MARPMKIAYLASRYPYVSHTFITREVWAMRARGFEVGTFSVRRSHPDEILGGEAQEDGASTRWLVPLRVGPYVAAFLWLIRTRPLLGTRTWLGAVLQPHLSVRERLLWWAYFVEAVQLAHWLAREGFEHLHAHFGNSGSSTAMLAARLTRLPFSLTCHGSELNDPERYRLRQKVAFARFVVCVSKYGKSRLMLACPREHWGKIHVVRCGLLADEMPEQDRAAGDSSRILCVGRLSPEKGHLVLLDALAILRKQGIEPHCTLVGDGPMRTRLEEQTKTLGLTPYVTFAGALEPADVAHHYRSAGVAVLASFSEGVPVVLMEAMAHGLPVVATRVGGVPELVEEGATGRVVSPGDAAELASALQQVLSSPDLAQAMGRKGRDVIHEHFSVEASARRLEGLFTASAAESGARAP